MMCTCATSLSYLSLVVAAGQANTRATFSFRTRLQLCSTGPTLNLKLAPCTQPYAVSCRVVPCHRLVGAEGSASVMHGPNVWPDAQELPGWQQQVQAYFSDMLELSRVIARGLALSLSLPETFFTDKMRDPVAQLLLLR